MAIIFTQEQQTEIDRRIAVATESLNLKFGQFLVDGQTQVATLNAKTEAMTAQMAVHNTELHANADRVSAMVDDANKKAEAIQKFSDTEGQLAQLTAQMTAFASRQNDVIEGHSKKLELLQKQTEDALLAVDGKLEAAVGESKSLAIAEITRLREQLHTWAVGVKAEIAEITEALGTGKGSSSTFRPGGSDGKGSGTGVDRKEVHQGAVQALGERHRHPT